MISHHRIIYDRRRKATKTTLLYIILLSFVLIYIIQATQKKHVHNTIGTDDAYPIGLSTKTPLKKNMLHNRNNKKKYHNIITTSIDRKSNSNHKLDLIQLLDIYEMETKSQVNKGGKKSKSTKKKTSSKKKGKRGGGKKKGKRGRGHKQTKKFPEKQSAGRETPKSNPSPHKRIEKEEPRVPVQVSEKKPPAKCCQICVTHFYDKLSLMEISHVEKKQIAYRFHAWKINGEQKDRFGRPIIDERLLPEHLRTGYYTKYDNAEDANNSSSSSQYNNIDMFHHLSNAAKKTFRGTKSKG
jgi:hypothetical protein